MTVQACTPGRTQDYPGGTKRLIQRSEGIRRTFVNGKVIYEDGKINGEMAGRVVYGPGYAGEY